jgi:hypothetical protein
MAAPAPSGVHSQMRGLEQNARPQILTRLRNDIHIGLAGVFINQPLAPELLSLFPMSDPARRGRSGTCGCDGMESSADRTRLAFDAPECALLRSS